LSRSFLSIVTILSICLIGRAFAGPNDEGQAALQRGDFAAAMQILRPLADQGDALAQLDLGLMYGNGQGVTKDWAEAAKCWRKAADQGNARAERDLGIYYSSYGPTRDYAQSIEWLRIPTQAGHRFRFDVGHRTDLMPATIPK